MSKRMVVLAAVSFIVAVLAVVLAAATHVTPATSATTEVTAQAGGSGFVFLGCWAYFPAGPCYDIYQDAQGQFWICSKCETTKNPGPKTCRKITQETLDRGYWCS